MNDPRAASMEDCRYWAFISYAHEDGAFARWLHRALETYRVPRRLVGRSTASGVVPRGLAPIFRDADELAAAPRLATALQRALHDSRFLILVCSPRSARARWVIEEVEQFTALHGIDRVVCVLLRGEPNYYEADGGPLAAFPAVLRAPRGERDARQGSTAQARGSSEPERDATPAATSGTTYMLTAPMMPPHPNRVRRERM